ncbi:MAG TPA: FtsX-like permease family protein [Chloroflexota bacterium]
MLSLMWLRGLIARRSARLVGAVGGVTVTVALLASIGSFIASSSASMTRRAVTDVPVDWQIQLVPGADSAAVQAALGQATPYQAVAEVGFADVAGLSATTNGTVQTTGAARILGIGADYAQLFPSELRLLIGATDGVLVAQQTAANLQVTVGDRVTIQRLGLEPVTVQIAGIVDLPQADSLFQAVGVPAGAAPQAPPDNVLIVPATDWHALFDVQAIVRPDSVRPQLHVRLTHDLPSDPESAYTVVEQRAHNLEARIAGSALVADNLGARLLGVRADALYARVLFLFLGLPGVLVATLLTVAVANSGADRRRREQALLRVRGASTVQILRLESLEALVVGAGGVIAGLLLAVLASAVSGVQMALSESVTLVWVVVAALAGLGLAAGAVLVPAWSQARRAARTGIGAAIAVDRAPLWRGVYLDLLLLGGSALAFWQMAGSGYQVVLAPEGVAQSSVAYQAFLAPVCLWLGIGLLALRLSDRGLARGRRVVAWMARPIAGRLAGPVSASLRRLRALVSRGVVLVALAVSFATSTAVFNTTYNAQSRVDAELTNGADVTLSGPTSSDPGSLLPQLAALPAVVAAQPMQHRFAYVGTDLQDLFGIDPLHISEVTSLSNAYFANGDARATLSALAAQPDGVLVAAETAKDYQLNPGDRINLRLQSATDHQYHVVPFSFIGIVREFPTAPKDSFLVANASYIAAQTATPAAEIVLLRTSGDAADVAARTRALSAGLAGVRVTDLGTTQRTISSSLTAIDLRGLTQLELAFAVLLVGAAAGLILRLGLAERQRSFAILAALGARPRQLGAFLWSETVVIVIGGTVVGLALGFGVAQMLVVLLTGVFDPPPDRLAVPGGYLLVLLATAVLTAAIAVLAALASARRPLVDALRDL